MMELGRGAKTTMLLVKRIHNRLDDRLSKLGGQLADRFWALVHFGQRDARPDGTMVGAGDASSPSYAGLDTAQGHQHLVSGQKVVALQDLTAQR